MNFKVAGVVVLYNPELKLLNNMYTYLDDIDVLYAVDNSETINSDIYNKLKNNSKINYIPLGENKGMAYALNHVANIAYNNDYNWLLTMDQDSVFNSNMFEKLLLSLKTLDTNDVGIVSSIHKFKEFSNNVHINKIESVSRVMTSGNLVSLRAWKKIDGFDEKLFIDEVDHDFCIRLTKHGFKILVNHATILEHHVGNYRKRKFLWGLITSSTTNHNYVRRYYITRNKLYMMKKHHLYKSYLKELRYDLCCILFKEQDKIRKLKSFLMGIADFIKGNMGKKIFH